MASTKTGPSAAARNKVSAGPKEENFMHNLCDKLTTTRVEVIIFRLDVGHVKPRMTYTESPRTIFLWLHDEHAVLVSEYIEPLIHTWAKSPHVEDGIRLLMYHKPNFKISDEKQKQIFSIAKNAQNFGSIKTFDASFVHDMPSGAAYQEYAKLVSETWERAEEVDWMQPKQDMHVFSDLVNLTNMTTLTAATEAMFVDTPQIFATFPFCSTPESPRLVDPGMMARHNPFQSWISNVSWASATPHPSAAQDRLELTKMFCTARLGRNSMY